MCNLLRGKRPKYLGVKEGKFLARCKQEHSPNSVSSQALSDDAIHYIAPLRYDKTTMSSQTIVDQLVMLIDSVPSDKTRIIERSNDYLYVEYSTPLLGFVDDVEFLVTRNGDIHVRSASRLGYSDLGANRKRVEAIRELWKNRSSTHNTSSRL